MQWLKIYEVSIIDATCYPQSIPGRVTHSSFSVPLPERFDSQEEADTYAAAAKQKNPKLDCSIREVED